MKEEVDLADVELDEMLGILRKFVKAERTGNWMLHLQIVRDMLSCFAATGHNT